VAALERVRDCSEVFTRAIECRESLAQPPQRGKKTWESGRGLWQVAEKLLCHAGNPMAHMSETSPVCLVHLVYPVSLVQPNKQDKPIKRDRPDRPNRPNEQDRLADFFSILLEAG